MTAQKIQTRIAEICTLFGFEYNGKVGNIDPYYLSEGQFEFLLFFDGEEKTVTSIDAVMNEPFFDGKSLNDIAEDITITEW
ncbi:MAG: hypothetical protein RR867_09440 [Ruthenibacterium sp.]